jgi:hypothetical protein
MIAIIKRGHCTFDEKASSQIAIKYQKFASEIKSQIGVFVIHIQLKPEY